jgi:hypothetical protein
MKSIVAGLALVPFLFQSYIAGPVTKPDANYPLHVHIFRTHGADTRRGDHGHGVADILPDGSRAPQGVDFVYECPVNPQANSGAEFYQARWKKPNLKLEILLQRVGSDKVEHCELDVQMKSRPFGKYE